MCSRVLIFILLAMWNHGTMSFVFGPLAVYTTSKDASSPVTTVSTTQRTFSVDADTTTATTPFTRRRPTPNRRRPNPNTSNIVFPSSDGGFPSFTERNKPMLYPKDNSDTETEDRLSPDLPKRPIWPKQPSQGSDDTIFFNGPSSSSDQGRRQRGRPTRRPTIAPADLVSEAATPDLASPLPPAPCPCPTTSESNPLCVQVRGARVTMLNLSQLKCAQMCLGPSDVRLLFHGRCQKVINKLNPFIHD